MPLFRKPKVARGPLDDLLDEAGLTWELLGDAHRVAFDRGAALVYEVDGFFLGQLLFDGPSDAELVPYLEANGSADLAFSSIDDGRLCNRVVHPAPRFDRDAVLLCLEALAACASARAAEPGDIETQLARLRQPADGEAAAAAAEAAFAAAGMSARRLEDLPYAWELDTPTGPTGTVLTDSHDRLAFFLELEPAPAPPPPEIARRMLEANDAGARRYALGPARIDAVSVVAADGFDAHRLAFVVDALSDLSALHRNSSG